MHDVIAKAGRTIKRRAMLAAGDCVLVAVSGGPDSVCLLSVLHVLAKELSVTLHVAHLDHGFRGAESAADAEFVGTLAGTLGLPATVRRIDVPAYCRERGLSSQEGARRVRYGFLAQAARDAGADRIATGHTADDQAETLLMRLMRGAGIAGLSAIPPVRENVIRPLIDVTREEVMDYLRVRGLGFRTDRSNEKPIYTRNRIRGEVIPLLKRFNPRIVETLAAEAALIRDEDEAVEAHLEMVAESAIDTRENVLALKRDVFDMLPPAFRRRLFRKLAGRAGVDASGLSLGRIDDALAFMQSARTGRTMNVAPGFRITREYNRFIVGPAEPVGAFSCDLLLPGSTEIPEAGLRFDVLGVPAASGPDRATDESNYQWQAEFDYDRIAAPLRVRSRCAGDRFRPAGMDGKSKKLQDYLVDEKVPRRQRDRIALLCAGDDLLWVVGMRTDGRFLAGPLTKRVLRIRATRLD